MGRQGQRRTGFLLPSSLNGLLTKLGSVSYVQAIESAVGRANAVLDVGCGNNSPLGRFRRRPKYAVGVDAYAPWLEESGRKGIHDQYVEMNALDLDQAFRPEQFDVVMACDFLEHLERVAAEKQLMMMERIAAQRVVVLTPNGFVPQDATWDNPYQVHRSGWTAEEMRRRGYQVNGLSGLKSLRGERGIIRFRPKRMWDLVSRASQPFAWRLPSHAFHILCVKDVASEAHSSHPQE
jgi:SAM-dependent methyltransferase